VTQNHGFENIEEACLMPHETILPPSPRLRRTSRIMKRSLAASCFLPMAKNGRAFSGSQLQFSFCSKNA
jgi:hypothetical protein